MSAADATYLYSWMVREPGDAAGWSQILVVLPGMGPVVLTHRDEGFMVGCRNIAIEHGKAQGQPVKLVRFIDERTLEFHE